MTYVYRYNMIYLICLNYILYNITIYIYTYLNIYDIIFYL